ncbi:6-phosphogluconolactonase [Actinomyces bowdenii]|uniref:6-phosphogluconolactonase n=1 Tax=Actinomyces bowdenii TaxID=131109 RepID=UPI00214C169C|nr:6-phosphogluconolactonase [Actinomyces bowdenii]MCR2052473.1 6-phosphogluconolactonase [Actinomyces bowdenii]
MSSTEIPAGPAAHGRQRDEQADLIASAAAGLPAPRIVVAPGLEDASRRAAQQTTEILERAIAQRGVAHLALTGGSAGVTLADMLAEQLGALPAPVLGSIHLWFGDERFVPRGDEQRNDLLAAPLVRAGIPESAVHRLAGPEQVADLEEATAVFARELAEHGPRDGCFDVVHLGLGPDAHVCSLFPAHPAALCTGAMAVAVDHSPKPPPQRCSLTFEAIHRAGAVMVVAGGAGKAQAVSASLGAPDAVAAPASCARGQTTTWYLDTAAAAGAPS